MSVSPGEVDFNLFLNDAAVEEVEWTN